MIYKEAPTKKNQAKRNLKQEKQKIMANGIEDLKEKNKGRAKLGQSEHYDFWRTFQGREDAEMLQEKSANWANKKSKYKEYDSWGDDD